MQNGSRTTSRPTPAADHTLSTRLPDLTAGSSSFYPPLACEGPSFYSPLAGGGSVVAPGPAALLAATT